MIIGSRVYASPGVKHWCNFNLLFLFCLGRGFNDLCDLFVEKSCP